MRVKLDEEEGRPTLWRQTLSSWNRVESSYDEATGTLSALIRELGSYRVTWDESGGPAEEVGLLIRTVPNPFRTTVGVRYHLPVSSEVSLAIHDASGRKVRTLVNKECGPGWHSEVWDGRDEGGKAMPSGVYFTILEAGRDKASRKCVLVR